MAQSRAEWRVQAQHWIALPALVTLALGLWGLGRRQLWQDEHATWWAASLSWPDLAHLLETVDAVLAPYYALMHGWIALFGASTRMLRLPSTLALAACALLVGRLGSRLFGPRVGFAAAALFAAVPSVSVYAHEARPYALAMLACAASALALLRAIEAPERAGRWALYTLSVAAIGASHLVALCVLSAHVGCILALAVRPETRPTWRPLAWRFGLALGLALALLAPLVWLGKQQSGQVGWIRADWDKFVAFPGELFFSTLIATLVMGLSLFALVRARWNGVLLGIWAIFPPLFLFVTFDQLHLFLTRYLLFTLPAWAVLGAFGLCELLQAVWPLARAPVVLALVGLLWVAVDGQSGLRQSLPSGQCDYRGAANKVRDDLEPGDAIAFDGPSGGRKHLRVAFHYHFRKPPPALPRDVFVQRTAAEAGAFMPELCEESRACLPADVRRLWLVTTARHDLFESMPEERAQLLQSEFEVSRVMGVHKVRIALLTRLPRPTAVLP